MVLFALFVLLYFKRQVYFVLRVIPGLALACCSAYIRNIFARRLAFVAINVCAFCVSDYLLVLMGLWLVLFGCFKFCYKTLVAEFAPDLE